MLVAKQVQLNHTENKMQLRPDWMYRTECRTLADSQICRALPDCVDLNAALSEHKVSIALRPVSIQRSS